VTEELPISEQRQRDRLAALPAVYKTQHDRLACEIAIGLDEHVAIFARHGYTTDQALALLETREFSLTLERVTKEVRESGLSFRSKARAMAEDLLPHAYEIATDEYASAAVRADIIQWMARVADLEPAKKDGKEPGTGGGLTLNITFAGQEKQAVITGHEPITIEG